MSTAGPPSLLSPVSVPPHIVMACVVMAYIVMAHIVMVYIVMVCIIMAYIVIAYIVMACIVMAVVSVCTCASAVGRTAPSARAYAASNVESAEPPSILPKPASSAGLVLGHAERSAAMHSLARMTSATRGRSSGLLLLILT